MSAKHILSLSAIVAVAACLPATAQAQTLTASRNQLYFVHQRSAPGSSNLTQEIDITASPNVPITVTASTGNSGPWLLVGQNNTATPARLTVLVNPNVNPPLTPATYTGTITVTPQSGTPLNLNVTLVVSDNPLVQPNTTVMRFQFSRGGQLPAAQQLALNATAQNLNYALAGVTASGGDWLRVEPTTGTIQAPGISSNVNVSIVNAIGLPVGTYTGLITITAPAAANSGLQVQVVLQVLEESRITTSPSSIGFEYVINSNLANERVLYVTSTSGSIPFRVEAVSDTGGTWLSAANSNATFTTPAYVQLTAAQGTLGAGTYNGRVRIISTAATNSPFEIPVTFRVTPDAVLSTGVDSLRFSFQTGGPVAPRQSFHVSAVGSSQVTAEAQVSGSVNWLNVTPTRGVAPTVVSVGVDPTGLAAGTYTGNVRISGNAAGTPPINIPVTFVVAAAPVIRLSDSAVTIVAQQNGNPPEARTVAITSTGAPVTLAVSTNSTGGWLSATLSANATPATLNLAVNATNLPNGIYTGSVSIGPSDTSTPTVVLPVRLQVTSAPSLIVNQSPLVFSHAQGSSTLPANQTFRIGSTSGAINFNLSSATADGANWLVISRTQGTTGGTDTIVAVNPAGLGAGTYVGIIAITAAAPNNPQFIPVVLTISGQAQDLTVTPATLTFNQNVGSTVPPSQTLAVRLVPDGRVAFTVTTALVNGTGWLAVSPTDGITSQDLTVSVSGTGLAAGTYAGTITITPVNAPGLRTITIPVTFNVTRLLPNLNLARETLNFSYTIGGPNALAQQVAVTSGGDPIAFTVATQPQNSWLQATPPLGNTPNDLSISVNPNSLSPGSYSGTVIVSSTGAANSPRIINVTLTVSQPSLPVVTRVDHSATLQATAAAPGLIATIRVNNIGNIPNTSGRITPSGSLDTTLANVRVLFDGTPAPMLFINSNQINCVIPYAVAGRATTRVTVDNNGSVSQPLELRVVDAAPGIYRLNQAGQGAVVNENGTINGANTPAPRNTIIAMYATGEGSTSPPGVDGFIAVTADQIRRPLLPVRVRIGGQDAEVVYAASAPGFVSGAFLVYAIVPRTVTPGTQVPLELLVGGVSSGPGTTVAIQ